MEGVQRDEACRRGGAWAKMAAGASVRSSLPPSNPRQMPTGPTHTLTVTAAGRDPCIPPPPVHGPMHSSLPPHCMDRRSHAASGYAPKAAKALPWGSEGKASP